MREIHFIMKYADIMAQGVVIDPPYSFFFHIWPYIGFGAAIVLIILIFFTDFLRSDKKVSRWKDPAILAWMGAVIYLLHNMEEYGVDLYGHPQAFTQLMYALMGFRISEAAYLACNLGLVWVMGPLAAVLSQKGKYGMAAGMAVFEIINGLSHIGQAINLGCYNPGLANAITFCLPIGIWTIWQCYWKMKMPKINLLWLFLAGLLYHLILLGGIFAAKAGLIGGAAQGLIMAIGAILTFGIWYLVADRQQKREAARG